MEINIIVAASLNGVIGKEGKIPWSIPEDLKRFKEITMGSPCIMGRKTFESLPKGPLKGRLNVVISSTLSINNSDVKTVLSFEEAIKLCEDAGYEKVFICGGDSVYRIAKQVADKLYLTVVHKHIPGGDAFFTYTDHAWNVESLEKHGDYDFYVLS